MRPLKFELRAHDLLYFLHIPKTAGMSLLSVLGGYFDRDQICHLTWWALREKELGVGHQKLSNIRLVSGHFGYELYRHLPRTPIYITMLRNPVDRTLSQYAHHQCRENFPNHPELVLDDLSLTEFITGHRYAPSVFNPQTRRIARHNNVTPQETPDDILLEMAKNHLDEFAFFGIKERFRDSIELLCYTFGWRLPRSIPIENTSLNPISRTDISSETIGLIEERTKLDSELYRFAMELFQNRVDVM